MTLKYALLLCLMALFLPFAGQAEPRVHRNVFVEWEPVQGATLYEIRFTRKGAGNKPMTFQSKVSTWSATIKPGLYLMQIRSFDDRGVPGSWSPPTELEVRVPAIIATSPVASQTVDSPNPDKYKVKFEWEPAPSAKTYVITGRALSKDWSFREETEETSVDVEVPVGQTIEWQAYAISTKGEEGDRWEEPLRFNVRGPPLRAPRIASPLSEFVREMRWTASPRAESYNYSLKYQDPQTGQWADVSGVKSSTERKMELDISRPSGLYRLHVQAIAKGHLPSPVQTLEFKMRGGFRDREEWENAVLRDSLRKPTAFYGIASYLITEMNYGATDYDKGIISSVKALGGTGRLGLGYQRPDSVWGGFGIVDLSGFIIGGKNFRFASVEMHLTRELELGQASLLSVSAGLFSKELPIVRGSEFGYDGVGVVRSIGPHAGFVYWMPLNERYGVQVNSRIYYSLTGSTDTDSKILPSISYQVGILGSYRLRKNWMGFAGYAYRYDQALYSVHPDDPASFASPGQTSSITVDGNYLNLILEIGF